MKTLNILHISDAHIQKKDENEISELVQKLIKDIQRVQKQQDLNIDLICFTGDLIQSGKNATCNECQWEMANSAMIEPLLSGLNLTRENFIIVPGNHEVDTSKIVGATEKGLLVDSLEEINANIKEMHESYLERLSYFYDGIRNMYNDVITEKIGYAFNRIINGINVGIVCLDTAWRSSGRGEVEKGIMYVGEQQIRDLYKHIKSSEIKICLMHHPTDWLSGYESSLIEKQLNKFDVVLCGHVHENDSKVIMRKEMNTIYNIAGKIYPLDFAFGRRTDGYNGYAILNLNLDISLCTIFMRTYYAKDREDFDAAINFCKEGKIEYPLNEDIEEKKMEYGIINGLKKFYLSMSEKLSLINRIDSEAPEDISTVYVEPILADRSEYDSEGSKNKHTVELQEIVNGNENIVCIGKKESGKTTILQNVGIVHVEEYTTRKIIPVYIDMRNLPKKGNIFQNAVTHFIEDNAEKDTKISRKKIEEIIDNGKCIFLIDNVDIYNSQHTELIKNFIKSNEGNKYIIAVQEQFFQALDIKKIPDYGCEFKKVFIHSFRKNQIRELVTKWANGKVEATDVGQVVDKIDGYCNQINFAKTPFNISIFMVLWDFNRNFVPQNEAYVMDNYLEIVLEKLSSKEGDRNSYGY